ncbi:MAG: VCBS repeat-containing protein [Phycisphaerae bacterium]|nr:VCBS repeat-containing protein [Phycisphaerae bacterium]
MKPTLAFAALASAAAASFSATIHADVCFGVTPYPVGIQPSDVAAADLNLDGYPDLVVANHDPALDNRIAVLLNQGDGTFAASVFYDTGDRPYWLAAGDFNGDGLPDVAVTNYAGASISVFLNVGGGALAPQILYEAPPEPTFIHAADVTGDGAPELLVASQSSSTVTTFVNAGDGTFAAAPPTPVGYAPYGLASGDFDLDGDLDVAVSNYGTGEFNTEIGILLNQGDGTFARQVVYLAGYATVGLAAADLDNDGDVDLAGANLGFFAENDTVSVLRNQGDGTFAPHVEYVVGAGPYDVAASDFNGDGFADLVTGNEQGTVSILLNQGDGTFAPANNVPIFASSLGVAIADFDANATPEIALAAFSTGDVFVLYNEYVGIVAPPSDVVALPGDRVAFSVVAGGPGPLTYQWRKDGVDLADGGPVSGATGETLLIAPASVRDAGAYDVVVANACGSVTSAPATLSVTAPRCTTDLDGNGTTDGADLGALLGNWGGSGTGDFDASGTVDGADLGTLLGSWGPC